MNINERGEAIRLINQKILDKERGLNERLQDKSFHGEWYFRLALVALYHEKVALRRTKSEVNYGMFKI